MTLRDLKPGIQDNDGRQVWWADYSGEKSGRVVYVHHGSNGDRSTCCCVDGRGVLAIVENPYFSRNELLLKLLSDHQNEAARIARKVTEVMSDLARSITPDASQKESE